MLYVVFSDLVWIQFRQESPSEECINKAVEAMAAAQQDFSALEKDEN